MNVSKKLLTAKEAAKYLGISIDTFNGEIRKGKIGYLIIGRSKRFTKLELDKCLNNLTYSNFSKEKKYITHTSRLYSKGNGYSFVKQLAQEISKKQSNTV